VIELKPYSPHQERITIRADLELRGEKEIFFRFSLLDPADAVLGAPVNGQWLSPTRAHGLWQSTCFESFFTTGSVNDYWELNLSPEGRWNLYHFQSYRSPQPPTESTDFTLSEMKSEPGELTALLRSKAPIHKLRASLCAVIKTASATHYYSTKHSGVKPDFHLAESFTLAKGSP